MTRNNKIASCILLGLLLRTTPGIAAPTDAVIVNDNDGTDN